MSADNLWQLSFNGAALTGARMGLCPHHRPGAISQLQRGRAHGGADGPGPHRQTAGHRAASTGPRSRGRGWVQAAATPLGSELASTGPRSRGRGWIIHSHAHHTQRGASTGPRSRGRGWEFKRAAKAQENVASTGPRSRGRGWVAHLRPNQPPAGQLQRGRAHGGADGLAAADLRAKGLGMLQRGRAHGGADGSNTGPRR